MVCFTYIGLNGNLGFERTVNELLTLLTEAKELAGARAICVYYEESPGYVTEWNFNDFFIDDEGFPFIELDEEGFSSSQGLTIEQAIEAISQYLESVESPVVENVKMLIHERGCIMPCEWTGLVFDSDSAVLYLNEKH